MTDFKIPDEAVEAACAAFDVVKSWKSTKDYKQQLARTALEAALLVMFEQCGWWYETPHGRVVTKTMIDSDSNPLYRIKEPK